MIRGFVTPGFATASFTTPSFTPAANFTDRAGALPTIVDPRAGVAGADPKAPASTAAIAADDDALHVLRGVGHTADAQAPGVFTSPADANADQRVYPNLGSLGDADIMAVAFIVMMEATKSAQEDLKSIMDGVKSINNAKSKIRAVADEFNPYLPK